MTNTMRPLEFAANAIRCLDTPAMTGAVLVNVGEKLAVEGNGMYEFGYGCRSTVWPIAVIPAGRVTKPVIDVVGIGFSTMS